MLGCARDVYSLGALHCKTYFVFEIGGIGATAAARWELKLNFGRMSAWAQNFLTFSRAAVGFQSDGNVRMLIYSIVEVV